MSKPPAKGRRGRVTRLINSPATRSDHPGAVAESDFQKPRYEQRHTHTEKDALET